MKKRRLLSALLAASLLCTMAPPATVLAAEANTETVDEQNSISRGALTVTGGQEGTDYEWQDNTLVIKTNTALTISDGFGATVNLKIGDSVSAQITMDSVDLQHIDIPDNASLTIDSSNRIYIQSINERDKQRGSLTINSGDDINFGDIFVKDLTINGGYLNVYRYNGDGMIASEIVAESCTINGGTFSGTGGSWSGSGPDWEGEPLISATTTTINGGSFSKGDIGNGTVFGSSIADGKALKVDVVSSENYLIYYKVVDEKQINKFQVKGNGYSYSNQVLKLSQGANVTVSSNSIVNDYIVVGDEDSGPVQATLTLNGVEMYGRRPLISVGEGSSLTLILADGSKNELECRDVNGPTVVDVPYQSTLTIKGKGALNVKTSQDGIGIGGLDGTVNIEDGDLTVVGGGTDGVAIGGWYMKINISGGDINAIADPSRFGGTGIGGEDTQVYISGGNIVAEGGTRGAAILGIGYPTSSIKIDGGTIKAATYEGAPAICGTNIEINGGSVYAEAPIGTPSDSDERIQGITINGGTVSVKLPETSSSACIGGRNVGVITISNGMVITSGGARGIGSSAGGGDTIFSTGEGNPVIITSSISDVSGRDNWHGVFFVDNMNRGVGKVYGTTVTPTNDFTIPEGKTLEVDSNQSLIVADGITATNNGTVIRDKNGVVDVQGKWLGKPVIVKGAEEGSAVTGITLDKSILALAPGKTATLAATVAPQTAANKEVRWTSSNTGVVTVDATGKVTAVANGTAVITVSTVDGGYTAQCTVTVSEDTPEVVAVENVKLDRSSLTLDVGETEQLTATVTPENAANKSVRWRSNDENVVSVDANGKLTAIDSGIATVTVTTEEGNFTALCKVTVVDPDDTTTDTETKPDGSTVTTVEDVNGSSSTTTVDKNGVSTTTVALSETIVEQAARNDAAVILPMVGVTATTNMNTAPSVTVDLPGSAPVKVEIPVLDLTPGTVAVLVDADGNETVIPNSVLGNNGLIVTLEDGDTVKIFDNTQSYGDVAASHWAKDNIDYVTSRGLFVGVDDANFAPETSMTRAMIVSVLQRYAGDTTAAAPGSDWYEGARQWAIAHGISDGTNMNGNVTREQLVTMLYRYIGSPQVVGSLADYSDNASVSPYAEQAMVWAVRNGIIGGMTADTLAPQGLATRAQVAAILERFIAWEQA